MQNLRHNRYKLRKTQEPGQKSVISIVRLKAVRLEKPDDCQICYSFLIQPFQETQLTRPRYINVTGGRTDNSRWQYRVLHNVCRAVKTTSDFTRIHRQSTGGCMRPRLHRSDGRSDHLRLGVWVSFICRCVRPAAWPDVNSGVRGSYLEDCMTSWAVLRHLGTDTLGGSLGGGSFV